FIAVGILSVLSVVTLRQQAAGADVGSLVVVGKSLVALKNWTFLLGPGFVVGVGNGLLLGYLMYRSGLMPRPLAVLGLVGGPLVCGSGIAVMFGVFAAGSVWQGVATIPEILWELSLGIYLTVKGFKSSSITAVDAAGQNPRAARAEREGGLPTPGGQKGARGGPSPARPPPYSPQSRRDNRPSVPQTG